MQRTTGNRGIAQLARQHDVVQRATDPDSPKQGRVVTLGPVIETMIAAATLPVEAIGSTPRMLVTETMRGFAWQVKAQMTGELGEKLWSRFVELGTSPRLMVSFVLHYWWGLIKGIFSPITGLFDLVKLVWAMQKLQAQLLVNAWAQRAGLAADAGRIVVDLLRLGNRGGDAIRDLLKRPPDQVIKLISGWLDQLRGEAAKAAWNGGSTIARKLLGSLDVPLPQLAEIAGEIIGAVLINIVLFIFTDGIGNLITEIAAKLGQLGIWLSKLGKAGQMLAGLAAQIGKLLAVVGGWVTRAEQAIAKVAEALLKPLKPVLDEMSNAIKGLQSFLRRLFGVAEKEVAPVVTTAAGAKAVPPIRTVHASETGVIPIERPMPPVETVKRPTAIKQPRSTGEGIPAAKDESFPDLPSGKAADEAVVRQGPLSELEGPQKLPAVANLESIDIAKRAGVPDLITADGTVMTRSDFPDLLPDAPSLIGRRPAPAPLATAEELVAQGRPVSVSQIQNLEVRADAQLLLDAGANPASLRVNQGQVIGDVRVGTNRPDFHAELHGRRVHIEYDRAPPSRALDHARRILSNDPDAIVILKVVDWEF